MDDTPTVEALLYAARNSREEHGAENFWAPIIVYTSKTNGEALAMLAADEPVPQQLVVALIQLQQMLGPAAWIAFTGDTYASFIPTEEVSILTPKESRERFGIDLEEEFKKGSERVVEMMMVLLASPEGIAGGSQQYRYTPVDGWEWDEPKIQDEGEGGGRVHNVLMAFFQAQQMAGY